MQTFVYHDKSGVIDSIVTIDAGEGIEARVEVGPALTVTEVRDAGLTIDRETLDATRESLAHLRVDVHPAGPGTLRRAD